MFWDRETPLQIAGLTAGELALGLTAGYFGATIGGRWAQKKCLEKVDPDFSDECGWSGLGGAILGLAITLPLGQGLGVSLVGALQGKHGNPFLTTVVAYVGDLATFFVLAAAHNVLDGKLAPDGALDPWLVGLGGVVMTSLPVWFYTSRDYAVSIEATPKVSFWPSPYGLRTQVRLALIRF